ncbi:Cupin domain protein [Phycisphaerae bacterium RAS1]|nr:Cupin domain protein [Phycisphaerae bacterium RAS1]
MLEVAMDLEAGLQVLAGAARTPAVGWSGSLCEFFDVGRRFLRRAHADIRSGRLRSPAFLFGSAGEHGLGATLEFLSRRIDHEYPIELRSPFEETESIAGALWSGKELLGEEREDGLAKLRFARGTLDLPVHVHEHSDRFIAVLRGAGRFWWSEQTLDQFDARQIESVSVVAGDVLVFTRNLLHTFSAPDEELVLLSYHSPEIPFDDPRQYTIPATRWAPRFAQLT